jgi:hypothetical protein
MDAEVSVTVLLEYRILKKQILSDQWSKRLMQGFKVSNKKTSEPFYNGGVWCNVGPWLAENSMPLFSDKWYLFETF